MKDQCEATNQTVNTYVAKNIGTADGIPVGVWVAHRPRSLGRAAINAWFEDRNSGSLNTGHE